MKQCNFWLVLGGVSLLVLQACGSGKNVSTPVVEVKPEVKVENAEVSKDTQLVNAVHNYDLLTLDKRLKLVTVLLEKGANPNSLNELGEPILADAVHFGVGKDDDARLVKLLVEKGADINLVGKTGRSALTKAAEFDKVDLLKYFFENGLDINTENGAHALVKAAFVGNRDVVDLFMAHGFKAGGKYETALRGAMMKSEETQAAAAVFGAYVDIAKEELYGLLQANPVATKDEVLGAELQKIGKSCEKLNEHETTSGNNSIDACGTMGRLGGLVYMHCYGLLQSHSANLEKLQANTLSAVAAARAPLKLENVKFSSVTSSQELLGYDQSIKKSMAMYADLILPWMKISTSRLGHHQKRNQELQDQARECGSSMILGEAENISSSLQMLDKEQKKMLADFQVELASMDQMRAKIAYQLPALNSTEVLKQREAEELKRQQEEQAKKEQEEKAKKEQAEKGNGAVPTGTK